MDNHHVHITQSHMSCGVAELYNIGPDLRKVLYAIATSLYHPARGTPYALITWSDLAIDSNGAKLGNFIQTGRHGDDFPTLMLFGSCFMTFPFENPKTGNIIKCWWWMVDHEKFKEWYVKERVERAKKL